MDETYPEPKSALPIIGTTQWMFGYAVQANAKSPTVTNGAPRIARVNTRLAAKTKWLVLIYLEEAATPA